MLWLDRLAEDIAKVAAGRAPGSVVLLDFLPRDEALELRDRLRSSMPTSWDIEVVGKADPEVIGADQAVDLREDVSRRLCFIVLRSEAGAGLQGVYDVADVIDEVRALRRVRNALRAALAEKDEAVANYAREAERQSRFLTGRVTDERVIYGDLAYYSAVLEADDLAKAAGTYLHHLGLIPDQMPVMTETARLSQNAEAVRTLLGQTRRARLEPINERIAQLELVSEDVERELERFLRDRPMVAHGDWLSELPRSQLDFSRWRRSETPERPEEVSIRSFYRESGEAPYKWTGLHKHEERDYLMFSLHEDSRSDSFEVRWDVTPGKLRDAACAYRVSLLSATTDEPLLEDRVKHRALKRGYQKWTVGKDDLAEYHNGEYLVRVQVAVEGDDAIQDQTEDFLITSELLAHTEVPTAAMREVRCMVDAHFADAVKQADVRHPDVEMHDEGYTVRFPGQRVQLVRCPALLRQAESLLLADGAGPAGVRVELAPDGTPVAETLRLDQLSVPDASQWDRLIRARRTIFGAIRSACEERSPALDPAVECVLLHDFADEVREYARAALNALQSLNEGLLSDEARAHNLLERYASLVRMDTILLEKRTRADDADVTPFALLVSPTHPLRMLWLLAYEKLAWYWLGLDDEQPPQALLDADREAASHVQEALQALTAQHFPAYASWGHGDLWQYFSSLGLHWGMMLPVGERDPQGVLSAVREAIGLPQAAPTGLGISVSVLADKLEEYLRLHPFIRTLHVNGYNPGDGEMQEAVLQELLNRDTAPRSESADEEDEAEPPLSFNLRMVVDAETGYQQVGRRFDLLARRRQRGDSLKRQELALVAGSGDPLHPHFVWSRLSADDVPPPAHVSLLVDHFHGTPASITARDPDENPEAYGLVTHLSRQLNVDDALATFIWWVEPLSGAAGSGHPADPRITRELRDLHSGHLKLVNSVCQWSPDDRLPAVRVQVDQEKQEMLAQVHASSDWVMTLDRHLGVEYFDYPEINSDEFERYLIDYAPEYVDQMSHQLAVSTERVDELQDLLAGAVGQLGMTPRPEALRKIISLLSSISGHLAMRISSRQHLNEIVALAVVRHFLGEQGELREGILVPVDVHHELVASADDTPDSRCDLLLVSPDTYERRDVVRFDLLEVKYRRHRNLAASMELRDRMLQQTKSSDAGLRHRHFPTDVPLEVCLRRRDLVRVLRFYLDRAERTGVVGQEPADKLRDHFNRMLLPDYDRVAPSRYRGFVYCPEIAEDFIADQFKHHGELQVTLLGRGALPREATDYADADEQQPSDTAIPHQGERLPVDVVAHAPSQTAGEKRSVREPPQSEDQGEAGCAPTEAAIAIEIGQDTRLGRPVRFRPTIHGNPHLMMVGIPGMGKTTAIINIVASLARQGVYSLMTDFHGDLSTRLRDALPEQRLRVLDAADGLPFNPMRLTQQQLKTDRGWVANAIDIAEIWSGIFPDFGEVQQAEIRNRLLEAYRESGYGISEDVADPPPFGRLYELLQKDRDESVSVRNICARLDTVFLMGIFREGEDEFVLSDLSDAVVCLDLHGLAQETNQLVAASFFLHKIYKEMFLRGAVERLTQYLVFDEAHRAANLRLLGRFMQESRKFGIGVIVSSQRVSDFSNSVLETPGNHLALQVSQKDARRLAPLFAEGGEARQTQTLLQNLRKFRAIFRSEDHRPHVQVDLAPPIWER